MRKFQCVINYPANTNYHNGILDLGKAGQNSDYWKDLVLTTALTVYADTTNGAYFDLYLDANNNYGNIEITECMLWGISDLFSITTDDISISASSSLPSETSTYVKQTWNWNS